MGRRKKEVVDVVENPTPMVEDAMNLPVDDVKEESTEIETENVVEAPVEESPVEDDAPKPVASEPVFKKIQCGASLVNVRAEPDGEVLFTIRNLSKIKVEDEKDGWVKISGYVMKELVKDL
jgi:hypothetical protein